MGIPRIDMMRRDKERPGQFQVFKDISSNRQRICVAVIRGQEQGARMTFGSSQNIVDGRERKDFKILLQAPHHSLEDYRFVMIGLNPIVQRRMLDAVKANGSRTSHRAQKMRRNETAKISSDLPDARHGPDNGPPPVTPLLIDRCETRVSARCGR